jgi:hypothetical protein
MHTLGKVLMFFVIVGALAGTYLSARLLDTRAGWMYSLAPNSTPVQGPTIQLGIGSNAGLAATDFTANRIPTVHLFHVNEQGASQYLGQFVIDSIAADRAGATLNRAPFPGETESWPSGTYRVRTSIPAPWGEEFTTLWSQYGSILQMHDAELAMEARQQQALADATSQLDERMQELQGHPDAPADAGIVERVGIVEAMRLAEISRDEVLAELDALRREYSEKWYELDALLKSNSARRELLNPVVADPPPEGTLQPASFVP